MVFIRKSTIDAFCFRTGVVPELAMAVIIAEVSVIDERRAKKGKEVWSSKRKIRGVKFDIRKNCTQRGQYEYRIILADDWKTI